jgi:hypothetical protein
MEVVLDEWWNYGPINRCEVFQAIEMGNRVLRKPEELDDDIDPGPFTPRHVLLIT